MIACVLNTGEKQALVELHAFLPKDTVLLLQQEPPKS